MSKASYRIREFSRPFPKFLKFDSGVIRACLQVGLPKEDEGILAAGRDGGSVPRREGHGGDLQGRNSIRFRILPKMFTKILTKIVTKKLPKSYTKKFMR